MNEAQDKIRIDKWLWAVRICKTRLMAADLCDRGKVLIDRQSVKPSRHVQIGQIIVVRRDGVDWTYEVLRIIDKRVSAKIAEACKRDMTPIAQIERRRMIGLSWTPRRDKGAGRPTKRERRLIEKVLGK